MKYAIFFLLLFAVTVRAYGEEVKYRDPELHYSIKLPEGWRRLPPAVTDRAAKALSLQTGVPSQKFQAWFQRSDKPEGAYPYLLINSQICQMPTLGEIATGLIRHAQAAAEEANKRKGVVSNSKIFDPVIDNRRTMVFYEIEQTVNINETGKVKSKICTFPGKAGVAQLNFCTAVNDVGLSKVEFDYVLDSFAFEQGYGYQSGLVTDEPTPDFDFSRLLMFGVIGGVLSPLCYRLLKSRTPNATPSILGLRVVFVMLIVLGGIEFFIDPPSGSVRLAFVVGCVVVGVVGLAVSWIIEMKKSPPLVKEKATGVPPSA